VLLSFHLGHQFEFSTMIRGSESSRANYSLVLVPGACSSWSLVLSWLGVVVELNQCGAKLVVDFSGASN
jgi:hypothetical protein